MVLYRVALQYHTTTVYMCTVVVYCDFNSLRYDKYPGTRYSFPLGPIYTIQYSESRLEKQAWVNHVTTYSSASATVRGGVVVFPPSSTCEVQYSTVAVPGIIQYSTYCTVLYCTALAGHVSSDFRQY